MWAGKLIVFDLFNAAASQRILYLVNKYITDEVRAKGEELMRKYDAYYPILRHKPEDNASILNDMAELLNYNQAIELETKTLYEYGKTE